jgi:hypothetical protein
MSVERTSITFQPHADCTDKDCDWYSRASDLTRSRAKRHVRNTGHSVIVIVEERSTYYLQETS